MSEATSVSHRLSSPRQQAKALLLIFESGEVTGQVLSTTVVARALHPQIFLGALSSDETLRDWLVYAGASSVTLTEQLIADTIIGRFYHTLGSQTRKAAAVQRASQAGYRVVAGQADRAQTLQEAHIAQARAVLIAIRSGEKMGSKLSIALMARALNPNGYILALSILLPVATG